jgi:hypothetical protein
MKTRPFCSGRKVRRERAITGTLQNRRTLLRSSARPDYRLQLFRVSAGITGGGLIMLGLIQHNLFAINSVLVLLACVIAYFALRPGWQPTNRCDGGRIYWALRTRNIGRMHRVERTADWIFLFTLVMMAGICEFITFAIAAK